MNKEPQIGQSVCVLQVDVITSPEELAKEGECYATLQKTITLPFVPFVGLRLALDPIVSDADEAKYLLLSKGIIFNRGLFKVASIIYYTERSQFTLVAEGLYERDLKSFHDSQEFHIGFFGFHNL